MSSPAHGKELDLAPSTKWALNYDRDSCTLARAFGQGDQQVIARFIQYEPGVSFDFQLLGKPLRPGGSIQDVRLRFGAAGEFVRTTAMGGYANTEGDRTSALFMRGRLDNLDPGNIQRDDWARMSPAERQRLNSIDPAVEAGVTSVTVRAGGRTITLKLGSMGPAMREMRKCTADLVSQWGLIAAEQALLASPPLPRSDPGQWLRSSDYPSDSLLRGEQALIRYRLMVDAAGRPTTCAIQSAIAKGNFAEVSCNLLQRRASFEPARKADGTPVPSYSVGSVRWVMAQ